MRILSVLLIVPLFLAACMQSESPASKPQETDPASSVVESDSDTTTSLADPLIDGTYYGRIDGTIAVIKVQNGQPESYRWSDYTAQSVTRSGAVIQIDQARLTLTRISANSFQGNWRFRGRTQRGVIFNQQ